MLGIQGKIRVGSLAIVKFLRSFCDNLANQSGHIISFYFCSKLKNRDTVRNPPLPQKLTHTPHPHPDLRYLKY